MPPMTQIRIPNHNPPELAETTQSTVVESGEGFSLALSGGTGFPVMSFDSQL